MRNSRISKLVQMVVLGATLANPFITGCSNEVHNEKYKIEKTNQVLEVHASFDEKKRLQLKLDVTPLNENNYINGLDLMVIHHKNAVIFPIEHIFGIFNENYPSKLRGVRGKKPSEIIDLELSKKGLGKIIFGKLITAPHLKVLYDNFLDSNRINISEYKGFKLPISIPYNASKWNLTIPIYSKQRRTSAGMLIIVEKNNVFINKSKPIYFDFKTPKLKKEYFSK